jgi:hypothetical protein
MNRLITIACVAILSATASAQEVQHVPRLITTEIGEEEAAMALMFLQQNIAGVPLPAPATSIDQAARMVESGINFVPPRRIAQRGDWIFLPRLDRAQDDGTFASGFALKIGQRHLRPWDRGAIMLSRWDFEAPGLSADRPEPSQGRGGAALFGGVGADFKSGSGIRSRRGWNTSGYPPQGTGSGTRGVFFSTDTTGFSNIVVQFDQRSSKTGSRWSRFDYTTDGRNFIPFRTNDGALSPPDTYRTYRFDLSGIPGVDDNPRFGFRVVSVFSPRAFQQNANPAMSAPDTAYMRANEEAAYESGQAKGRGDYGMEGSWRFDNVGVTGLPLDPRTRFVATGRAVLLSAAMVAVISALVLAIIRRRARSG